MIMIMIMIMIICLKKTYSTYIADLVVYYDPDPLGCSRARAIMAEQSYRCLLVQSGLIPPYHRLVCDTTIACTVKLLY